MPKNTKLILTDEELNFITDCYIRLRTNKTYQSLSKAFQNYINEFLDEQLLTIKKTKEKNNGR